MQRHHSFEPYLLRGRLRGRASSGWIVALVGGALASLAASGCGGDDEPNDGARGGRGGSSSAGKGGGGTSGSAGGAARGGRSGSGGAAGSDAEAPSSGSGGTAGGEGGEGGTTHPAGGSPAGNAGEPGDEAGSGGTSGNGASGSAGKGMVIDTDSYDGRQIFRYETFGNEQLWTGTLRLHEAISAALDPVTALGLGLKVDASALPANILETADLSDPATTVALIGLDAVIGVKGTVGDDGELSSVGITCALCHTDVDDSVMEGVGLRIDGAANRDLDPGAIIALSPGLAGNTEALAVLNGWGPGFYDPRWNIDGIDAPVVIPPIYGLAGVPLETYTGDGPVSYWNAYVAVTQMGGQGQFFDPRIDVAVVWSPDLVTPKLPALFAYQMTLEPPPVPASAFDATAAARGKTLFEGAARCGTCHSGETLSDAAETLHAPEETGMDATTAERSATGLYRTTPLRALLAHPPYFHDGSAGTLPAVVTHYDTTLALGLDTNQQADLVEYLKSL